MGEGLAIARVNGESAIRKGVEKRVKDPATRRFGFGCILATGVCSLLALILVGEIIFRTFYFELLKTREYPQIYRPDARVNYRYIPGKDARICVPSICKEFKINKNGFYGPPFELKKKQGVFRIAIADSSQTTGIWLDADENFAMKLQRLFDQEGYRVEVMNFSTDGKYRDVSNIRIVRDTVMRYSPDLVLLTTSMPLLHMNIRREVYKGYVLMYEGGEFAYPVEHILARVDSILEQRALIALYEASFIVRAACRYYMDRFPYTASEQLLRLFVRKKYDMRTTIRYTAYSVDESVQMLKTLRSSLNAHFADRERLFRSIVIGRFGDRERSGATPVSL